MNVPKFSPPNLLRSARVYLSGPMDFVADREEERRTGWRTRISIALKKMGVTVFDPWIKPGIRGVQDYGREDEADSVARRKWSFADDAEGAKARADSAAAFWPAMHTDLRMVDTSDFVIALCPTNIYSVGTPHEIILARQQRKPVLFVSPPVNHPKFEALKSHLAAKKDEAGLKLLEGSMAEGPIKSNAEGIPSQWYMPLVGGEHFFDGFGFYLYPDLFAATRSPLDQAEESRGLKKPLLPFLVKLNNKLPLKWDRHKNDYGPNDDWLLWELRQGAEGAELEGVYDSGI